MMLESIKKHRELIKAQIGGSFAVEKPPGIDIEKGKKATEGEIREYSGRKYQKKGTKWVPYKGAGAPAKKEDSPTKSPERPAEPDPTAPIPAPEVDVNKRFGAFSRYIKAVIGGSSKALIAYGSGGVGKTYTVTKQLEAAGKVAYDEDTHVKGDDNYDYIKFTGKMTAPEVYKNMFEHNGKLLLFDDCDSVLRDSAAINLFKGGLDSSGDGGIAYGTSGGVKDDEGEKIPKRFKFKGSAIFVSNLKSDQVPQPIKSRALRIDLTMTPEQTIDRIKFIAANKDGEYRNLKFPGVDNYTHEELSDIIDYLDKYKHTTSDLNVRTIGSLLSIKQVADSEGVDWKEDADHMIFSKSQRAEAINVLGLEKFFLPEYD